MIGSSRTEWPFCSASRKAAREAISKASADEFDLVIGAVDELHLEVDDREAGEHARAEHALETLLDAGDILLRHVAADDLRLEDVAGAGLVRLGHDLDAGELARAAGLLLVDIVDRCRAAEPLAIGDLRGADIGVNLIGATQDIDLDVEVELAHALEDGLARFLIGRDAEGRVLGRELRQRDTELFLVGLRLRLDCDFDHRLRELHPLEDHGLLRVAERVAGADVLEAGERNDVAREGLLDVLAVVGVHQQHAPNALLLLARRVDEPSPRLDLPRVDATKGDRADEGVVHDLESEHRERIAIDRTALHRLLGARVDAWDGAAVGRRRQVVDDRVEERLHALVLEGGAAEHGMKGALLHRETHEAAKRRLVRLLAVEIGGHGVVIELDAGLDQLRAVLDRLLLEVGRDLDLVEVGAERLARPHDALHLDQVNDALEARLRADRQLQADRLAADPLDDVVDAFEEVGADLVHLVDEHDARDVVLVGLAPHRLGLGLDALVAVEHADGAVENAQAALDLDREVDVAGRIDDVQPFLAPEAGGRRGGDGDAALLLLLHPIHGGGALMDLADLVRLAGVIEDPLGRRRLPGIDVRHDAEIAVILDRVRAGHRSKAPKGFAVTSGSARRRGWPRPSGAYPRAS